MAALQVGVLIVGAGPTGLGAATRLHQHGYDDWLLLDAVRLDWPLSCCVRTGSWHAPAQPLTYISLFIERLALTSLFSVNMSASLVSKEHIRRAMQLLQNCCVWWCCAAGVESA